jgi:tRNA G18 (ribose-2'-O)-methylase SpoU
MNIHPKCFFNFSGYENIYFFSSISNIATDLVTVPIMKKLLNEELNRKSIEEYRNSAKYPVRVLLDNVRSLNNIGSVFRTCDAFLVEGIILCGITACPPHREISKTALGATESVTWEYIQDTPEAIRKLKDQGYRILAVEQTVHACMLNKFNVSQNEKYVIIFGHEINGVDQEVVNLCDGVIEIPQHGTKHSLNVAVSAGIVLWEFFRYYINDQQ